MDSLFCMTSLIQRLPYALLCSQNHPIGFLVVADNTSQGSILSGTLKNLGDIENTHLQANVVKIIWPSIFVAEDRHKSQ